MPCNLIKYTLKLTVINPSSLIGPNVPKVIEFKRLQIVMEYMSLTRTYKPFTSHTHKINSNLYIGMKLAEV